MFGNNISKKRQLVYRFVTYYSGGGYGCGSGFFINAKYFLTCFHVAFGAELRQVRNFPEFQRATGNNEPAKLENFYQTRITKAEIELFDNSRHEVKLESFDEKHDIALFKLSEENLRIKICKIDWRSSVNYGDRVFFGGFPTHHDYLPDKAPFAVHEGIVSAFIDTAIGGDKYQHIQINSINLGGNSGAPLFRNRSTTVIGIINGNMNWGNDNVVFQEPNNTYRKGSLRTPLSIAYATPLKLLKEFIFKSIAA